MSQPFDKDKMLMLPRDRAAVLAHMGLDPINNLPPHEQVAAFALLFAVFTERFGLDPYDTFSLGMKLLRPERFHHKGNSQLEALQEYAGLTKIGAFD